MVQGLLPLPPPPRPAPLPLPLGSCSPRLFPQFFTPLFVDLNFEFLDLNCAAICCAFCISAQVLEVGCGNSRLGEELLREGVTGGVTCIDLSPVAVQRMRDRLAEQGTSGQFTNLADSPFLNKNKGMYFLHVRYHQRLAV